MGTLGTSDWGSEAVEPQIEPSITPPTPAEEIDVLRWLFGPPTAQPTTADIILPSTWPLTRPLTRDRSLTSSPTYGKKLRYECSICAEELPIERFLNRCATKIPNSCHDHLLLKWCRIYDGNPGAVDNSKAVCRSCLSRYLAEQFRVRGADRIQCIDKGCSERDRNATWKYYAIYFLPKQLRSDFNEELARGIYRPDKWVCPANCGCEEGWTAHPQRTAGWPHVQCPSCSGGFCAVCRVPWHAGISCQNFQRASRWQKNAPSPFTSTKTSRSSSSTESHNIDVPVTNGPQDSKSHYRSVREMQARGARLCPRCQTPIIKDGGCNHMWCVKCELAFMWRHAEKVHAVKEDNTVANGVRSGPLRCVGAWVWRRRWAMGLWWEENRKKKGKGEVCSSPQEEGGFVNDEGEEEDWDDEGDDEDEDQDEEDEEGEEVIETEVPRRRWRGGGEYGLVTFLSREFAAVRRPSLYFSGFRLRRYRSE